MIKSTVMKHPVTDLFNREVPDQLSFVTELLKVTFPSGASSLTLNESLLIAETFIHYSELKKTNNIIKPVLQTYLFLHSHMFYLKDSSLSSAIPLMKGDILFSDAMSNTLKISPELSSITLQAAGNAFDYGFRLITSESPDPEIIIGHKKSMLPSFLRFGLNYISSNHSISEQAFNLGMAYMLLLDLAIYSNPSETDSSAKHIDFSYLNALTQSGHNSAIEQSASLIHMYCNKCLTGTSQDNFLINKAEQILEDLLCLKKKLKLN